MDHAHLTSIAIEGRAVIASCDCGWRYKSLKIGTLTERRKDAKDQALAHWASQPATYAGGISRTV